MTRVSAFNPTGYPRSEFVIWGSDSPKEQTYDSAPGGNLNVGRVTVPAWHDGEVDVEPVTTELAFIMHPAIVASMPTCYIDTPSGRYPFAPVGVPLVATVSAVVTLWRARAPEGVAELVTYLYTNQPTINWEMGFWCESKALARGFVSLRFGVDAGPGCRLLTYDHPTLETQGIKLLDSKVIGDTQGATWAGVLQFSNGSTTAEEGNTMLAQAAYPLMVAEKWSRWGQWGRKPPEVTPAQVNAEFASNQGKPRSQPFAHLGYICNKKPGDSGEQADFGAWHHCTTVGSGSAKLLWQQYCAAMREACRPGRYFEVDGSPVMAADHPSAVFWDGVIHFNGGVSPDRLGRTYAAMDPTDAWTKHDDQHTGGNFATEQCLLTGSYLLRQMLRHDAENRIMAWTLPSTHPQHWQSTNDPGPGRAVGRTFQFVGQLLHCGIVSAAHRVVMQAMERFSECIYPTTWGPKPWNLGWRGKWSQGDQIQPYTIIGPDPRTTFPTQSTWAPWQDAICAMGLDGFLRSYIAAGGIAGFHLVLPLIQEMAEAVAKSLVAHGYKPDCTQSVAYMPIPGNAPPDNYEDPLKCRLDVGTDFARWDLTGVGVLWRRTLDDGLLLRCDRIAELHEPRARDTYVGTLP